MYGILRVAPTTADSAASPASWSLSSYTYKYQKAYGSPEVDARPVPIKRIIVSTDGLSARLICDNLRRGYVHEFHANGVRSSDGESLLHPDGYYTLNRIPKP